MSKLEGGNFKNHAGQLKEAKKLGSKKCVLARINP
jgi:hypothetical protein